jgi:hypothetical protein
MNKSKKKSRGEKRKEQGRDPNNIEDAINISLGLPILRSKGTSSPSKTNPGPTNDATPESTHNIPTTTPSPKNGVPSRPQNQKATPVGPTATITPPTTLSHQTFTLESDFELLDQTLIKRKDEEDALSTQDVIDRFAGRRHNNGPVVIVTPPTNAKPDTEQEQVLTVDESSKPTSDKKSSPDAQIAPLSQHAGESSHAVDAKQLTSNDKKRKKSSPKQSDSPRTPSPAKQKLKQDEKVRVDARPETDSSPSPQKNSPGTNVEVRKVKKAKRKKSKEVAVPHEIPTGPTTPPSAPTAVLSKQTFMRESDLEPLDYSILVKRAEDDTITQDIIDLFAGHRGNNIITPENQATVDKSSRSVNDKKKKRKARSPKTSESPQTPSPAKQLVKQGDEKVRVDKDHVDTDSSPSPLKNSPDVQLVKTRKTTKRKQESVTQSSSKDESTMVVSSENTPMKLVLDKKQKERSATTSESLQTTAPAKQLVNQQDDKARVDKPHLNSDSSPLPKNLPNAPQDNTIMREKSRRPNSTDVNLLSKDSTAPLVQVVAPTPNIAPPTTSLEDLKTTKTLKRPTCMRGRAASASKPSVATSPPTTPALQQSDAPSSSPVTQQAPLQPVADDNKLYIEQQAVPTRLIQHIHVPTTELERLEVTCLPPNSENPNLYRFLKVGDQASVKKALHKFRSVVANTAVVYPHPELAVVLLRSAIPGVRNMISEYVNYEVFFAAVDSRSLLASKTTDTVFQAKLRKKPSSQDASVQRDSVKSLLQLGGTTYGRSFALVSQPAYIVEYLVRQIEFIMARRPSKRLKVFVDIGSTTFYSKNDDITFNVVPLVDLLKYKIGGKKDIKVMHSSCIDSESAKNVTPSEPPVSQDTYLSLHITDLLEGVRYSLSVDQSRDITRAEKDQDKFLFIEIVNIQVDTVRLIKYDSRIILDGVQDINVQDLPKEVSNWVGDLKIDFDNQTVEEPNLSGATLHVRGTSIQSCF